MSQFIMSTTRFILAKFAPSAKNKNWGMVSWQKSLSSLPLRIEVAAGVKT
jgi:hypothetical protein